MNEKENKNTQYSHLTPQSPNGNISTHTCVILKKNLHKSLSHYLPRVILSFVTSPTHLPLSTHLITYTYLPTKKSSQKSLRIHSHSSLSPHSFFVSLTLPSLPLIVFTIQTPSFSHAYPSAHQRHSSFSTNINPPSSPSQHKSPSSKPPCITTTSTTALTDKPTRNHRTPLSNHLHQPHPPFFFRRHLTTTTHNTTTFKQTPSNPLKLLQTATHHHQINLRLVIHPKPTRKHHPIRQPPFITTFESPSKPSVSFPPSSQTHKTHRSTTNRRRHPSTTLHSPRKYHRPPSNHRTTHGPSSFPQQPTSTTVASYSNSVSGGFE